MVSILDLKDSCADSARKAEKWMMSHLQDANLYDSQVPDPVSYYKWPLALYARGKVCQARDLLIWVMDKSLSDNGDLISERSGFHKDFHSYANLWLVLAAIKLRETDLTNKLLGFLQKHHNKKTGGMITIPGLMDGVTEDPLSSCFLGMAACELKDQKLADLVLKYLSALIEMQPEHDKFWLRTKPDGHLITSPAAEADPKTYVINIGEPDETYYFLGAMCFFIAGYIENFRGNPITNTLVKRLKGILEQAGPEALSTIWAAKVAPGGVALYSMLSDEDFLEIAVPVIHAVLGGQSMDGYWLKGDKPWVTVSAEQCYWLTFISNRLK